MRADGGHPCGARGELDLHEGFAAGIGGGVPVDPGGGEGRHQEGCDADEQGGRAGVLDGGFWEGEKGDRAQRGEKNHPGED